MMEPCSYCRSQSCCYAVADSGLTPICAECVADELQDDHAAALAGLIEAYNKPTVN